MSRNHYVQPVCQKCTPEEREQLRRWNAHHRHPVYGWLLPQIRYPKDYALQNPVTRRRYLFKEDGAWWIRWDKPTPTNARADIANVTSINPGPFVAPDAAVAAMILAGWEILDSHTAQV